MQQGFVMSFIATASHVSFELADGRVLFQNLSFSLLPGVSALVGANGVGKTTLAKLLVGEMQPTTGTVRSSAPARLFRQNARPPQITVAEYLSNSYDWSILGEELLQGIEPDVDCSNLSGGEWVRVRLAAVLKENFLILDEPTNDLDRSGREAVGRFVRGRSGSTLIVSHDRECLTLAERIYELSNRGLQLYGGDFSFYQSENERERSTQETALILAKRRRTQVHQKRIEDLETLSRRDKRSKERGKKGGMPRILVGNLRSQAQVSGGKRKAAFVERESEAADCVHQAYVALKESPLMYAHVASSALPAQKIIAEAKDLNFLRGRWLYSSPLHFIWRGNMRVAICGGNGSGKSTLLSALAGASEPQQGSLKRGSVTTLWLDQRLSGLNDDQSVLENVRRSSTASASELRSGLAAFLFPGEAVSKKVGTLSGGERLRAALAQGFLSSAAPELILLD